MAFYGRLFLLLTGLILVGLSHQEPSDDRAGEFFGGLLMIEAGAMLVAASNDVVFLFVGLELVSIPTYLLLYLSRRTATTQEAATKYFYLSIFASGLVLYGLAFLYGLAGTTNLKTLAALAADAPNFPNLTIGIDRGGVHPGGALLPSGCGAAALLRPRRLPGVARRHRRDAFLDSQVRRLRRDDPGAYRGLFGEGGKSIRWSPRRSSCPGSSPSRR